MDMLKVQACLMDRDAIRIPKRAKQVGLDTGRVKVAVKGGSDKNANEKYIGRRWRS